MEQLSRRGIECVFGVLRWTVADLIKQWAQQLPPLKTTLDEARRDEMWSFVLKKTNKRWGCVALVVPSLKWSCVHHLSYLHGLKTGDNGAAGK